MEERPPVWRVAANILYSQSRTADNGWTSSLGNGGVANNFSPQKRIILRTIEKKVQDRERWRAVVNAVMNLWVHKMRGIYCLAENKLASQEGLCSME